MKKRKILRERRKRARIVPLVLALVMVVTMVNPSYVNASDGANENSGGFFSNAIEAVADFFGIGNDTETAEDGVQTFAVENADSTVDPDTTGAWQNFTAPGGVVSTQNIGRLWTDKSVFQDAYEFDGELAGRSIEKGQSDFLVSLSALSSMSNLRTTIMTAEPLDIVLVLDDSGSMAERIEVDPADMDTSQTYEIWGYLGYIDIRYDAQRNEWGYTSWGRWNSVDVNQETIYSSRTQALQSAVNSFIDQTATANGSITEENDKIRIAIVPFATGTKNVQNFTICEGNGVTSLKNTVGTLNSSNGDGATYADAGMEEARKLINASDRPDAQKVVIFFTDGEPNHGNGFDNDVAAGTVNTARDIKNGGTTIYTVGVFEDADPGADPESDSTANFNRFMHAVSSNYATASATSSNRSFNVTWGNRTPDSSYYKAAQNSGELSAIFDEIFDESTESVGSGSPIEDVVEEGNPNPGMLTFTDTLGSYMEVTSTGAGSEGNDVIQLAYGDEIFTSDNKTTEGKVDTYHFSGEYTANGIYGRVDLQDLSVTVTRSDDPAVGDVITVAMPASLIPLRNYDVDTDNNSMTVTSAYPVRLFYGVSVKQEAIDALNNPAAAGNADIYNAIMATNLSADKTTVDFYSNLWSNGNGTTTATFTPNEGNKFYYYTANTELFTDSDCTQRATWRDVQSANTLYYKDVYWVLNQDGSAEEVSGSMAINLGGAEWREIEYDSSHSAYIPAHTERADRPATLVSNKAQNNTATARTVLVPGWNGDGTVSQALGNNGKLSVKAPGSLEITKTVDWGNASQETQNEKNSFTFQVALKDSGGAVLSGTYPYNIYGTGSDPVESGTISNSGTVTISASQRVAITGLPADSQYTVTEQNANSNGFSTEDNSAGETPNTTDGIVEGTITAGGTGRADFKNTYHANSVNLSTEATLRVQKNLTGRDWRASDAFTFEIDGLANTAGVVPTPEPVNTVITVTDETSNYTAAFEDIQFDAPGEYRYAITEDNDTNPIAGIDYSAARYRVIVTVVDDGEGHLRIGSVQIEQRLNDDGEVPGQQPVINENTVVFTNRYDVNNGTTNIDGTKNYTDTTGGGNPINTDKFTFQLKALGGFDTATETSGDYTVPAADVPMPNGANADQTITTTNTGYAFGFGTISYDGNDVGKTFEYQVTEVPGSEKGMDYDDTSYTVQVAVTEVEDQENPGHMVIRATPNLSPQEIVFNNTYDPTDAETAIHGIKNLTGRSMKEGETFYFQLSAVNDLAQEVLPAPETVTVGYGDPDMAFDFQNMTFSKTGTYTFTVDEVADQAGGETTDRNGMTYDQNLCTVTVIVTDNNEDEDPANDGSLTATVTYANQGHNETDQAVFSNRYEANMNYGAEGAGGIAVTKQILDRPMAAGDFRFTIEGEGDASGLTEAEDENFTNTPAAMDGTATMDKLQSLTFDQDDAGKTYTFIVDEADPTDDNRLAGVQYDQSQYRVAIEVVDNGDGTMHTVTTVTKIKNSDGTDAEIIVIDHVNSDAEGYITPTFGFVNDYNPNGAQLGEDTNNALQVTKLVTGAPSPENVTYSFTLTATSNNAGNIQGLNNNHQAHVSTTGVIEAGASETLNFPTLTFTEPGTYTFTVQEDPLADDEGWTYDTEPKYITVVVTDRNSDNEYDGNLYIQDVTGNPARITNAYEADPVTVGGEGTVDGIQVQKTVTGSDSAETFSFQLEPVDPDNNKWRNVEAAEPNYDGVASIVGGVTQETPGTAEFGGITFKATGEYSFNITEVQAHDDQAEPAGWTYDAHTATVTVSVTDTDFDGQLEAEVEYDNSAAITDADKALETAAAFTNIYQPSQVTTDEGEGTAIQVTKKVTGADAMEAFAFSLKLADGQDGSNVFEGTGDNLTAFDGMTVNTADAMKDGESDTKTFGDITFTAAGDYRFVVDETTTTNEEGWTYDGNTVEVTVHVQDQSGVLVITGIEQNNPTFYNTYYLPEDAKSTEDTEGNDITGDMVGVGDVLTYTIDWVNNAVDENGVPVQADVIISDTIPTGTELVENSISEGGVLDGDTITWTMEEQAPGTSGQVSFQVTVTDEAAGTIVENSAQITIGENDPAISTVINPVPGKGVIDAPDHVGEGTVLTYKISFTNGDEESAAEVVDTLTKGQDYNEDSATVTINGEAQKTEPEVNGTAAEGQTLTWNLENLAAGADVQITFDVTVTRDAGTSVNNTATVNDHTTNTTTTPYPPDSKKDVASVEDPTISIDGKLAGVGDTLVYTIDWAAEGDGTLTITDTVPEGTAYVEDSADNGGVYDAETNTLTWVFEDCTDGDKGTVSFEVTITDDAVNYDAITNTASIQIGENEPESTNEVTTDIPKKTVDDTTPDTGIQVGDTLTYTIEYRNDTDEAATVTVTDPLPAGLTYTGVADGAEEPVVTDDGDSTQTLTWTFEDLAAGAEGTVSFYAVVNENATVIENPLTNRATVSVGNNEYDTNITDGDTEVETGSLTITKEIALTEGQGTEVDADKAFTFTVTLKDAAGQPLTGTYQYTIGESGAQELDLDENGQATIQLKTGEAAVIQGLPVGAGYTVAEDDYTEDGYTTTAENEEGTITTDGVTAAFTNTYKPTGITIGDDTNAGIQIQKTFTGRDWREEDSFEFTMTNVRAPEGVTAPTAEAIVIGSEGVQDGVNSAAFGQMTFDAVGEYEYQIKETVGSIGGVTYDEHTAVVTVKVTDAGDGSLQAEVIYDNSQAQTEADQNAKDVAAFTNTYEPGGTVQPGTGDAEAQLTKVLEGRDWLEGDQFSFAITADEDTPAETLPEETTVTVGKPESGNSNTFNFGPFTFNAEGVYHYTVREEGAGTTVNGITYSTNEAHITINVTDNLQGGFAASVTIANATFTNTYSAGLDYGAEGGLNLVKRLDGHDIAEGQFQFQVTPVSGDGYVSAEDAAKKAGIDESGLTVSTDAASMVDGVAVDSIALFNQMKFDQTDNGKTYAYQISEVQETKAGYQYDKTTYTVTISVSDDNNGVLTVTTVVSNGTDSTAYVYTSEDGQNTPAQVVFNNAYDGAGSLGGEGAVSIQADKELLNGQLSGNDFTFIVTDKNEAEVTRGTNDASGKITFNEVAYTTDKLIADLASGAASYDADSSTYTYQYEVTEDTSNFQDMGVIANVAHFNITVTVKDNGDGTLTTDVDYGQYGDGLTFQNTYGTGADIAVNIGGTKELAHADGLTPPDITGAYQFTISGQDENGNAAPLPENTTASNDANGNVSFGAIQYTMENVFGTTAGEAASDDVAAGEDGIDTQIAQRTKTYTYTVTESGNVAGVTNDQEASKTFTIVVTDNGDGTLSVTDGAGNTVVPGAQFTFVNTYSVTPSTSTPTGDGGITITKNLEGRALNEGEFTFEMTGLAGTISEGMAVTGTNDAAGNVALGGLEFSRPGTYEFRISEVIPETPVGGVTYDGMTYQATAEVTDNQDGTLAVAWTVKAAADGETLEQVTFTNTYKAAPAGVQFGALKRLDGDDRDLKAGEFTFQVKDESGKVVATAKNKADGSVRFDSITFDKAGTYTYTISEVKGSDETITYDETVYTAIVNVTDDLNGQLYASVTAGDGSALKMTFTNKYTKPAVPVEPDEGPTAVRTGDTAPILPIILVMAAALAAIIAAAAVILRRNRRQ